MDRFAIRKCDRSVSVRQEKNVLTIRQGSIILQHNTLFMPSSGQQHVDKKGTRTGSSQMPEQDILTLPIVAKKKTHTLFRYTRCLNCEIVACQKNSTSRFRCADASLVSEFLARSPSMPTGLARTDVGAPLATMTLLVVPGYQMLTILSLFPLS